MTSTRCEGAGPKSDAEALASALERIVFLECRVEQLTAVAAAERESAGRAREALAAAASREAGGLGRQGELEATLAAVRAENVELVRKLGIAEAARAAAEAARHGQGEGLAGELSAARAGLEAERRAVAARERILADAHARIADLEAAREHLFARLVAWQRACGTGESFDLAEFIAELRREIVALEAARDEGRARESALRLALDRAGVDAANVKAVPAVSPRKTDLPDGLAPADGSLFGVAATDAGEATRESRVSTLATSFVAEGRLGISAAEIDASFEEMRPAEARLAQRLAAEVASGPGALRLRAAARLVEVAGRRATAALAAAAGAEADPELRAALVEQLGLAGEPRALPRIARFLDDDATPVRAAAVEACVRLAENAEARDPRSTKGEAKQDGDFSREGRVRESSRPSDEAIHGQALRRGLADPEPRVRRRAALAATAVRGLDPGPMLAPLLLDPDRQVRRLAAAALGGTRNPGAALALFSALLDPEPTVRETAAVAASRLFGGDVRVLVALPPLQRDRAVARLRAHVTSNLSRLAPNGQLVPLELPVALFAEPEPKAEALEQAVQAEEQVAAPAVEVVRALEAEGAPAPADGAASVAPPGVDLEAIAGVLRATLRGGTLELLARELRCAEATLVPLVDSHLAAGDLVRRGKKLFLP